MYSTFDNTSGSPVHHDNLAVPQMQPQVEPAQPSSSISFMPYHRLWAILYIIQASVIWTYGYLCAVAAFALNLGGSHSLFNSVVSISFGCASLAAIFTSLFTFAWILLAPTKRAAIFPCATSIVALVFVFSSLSLSSDYYTEPLSYTVTALGAVALIALVLAVSKHKFTDRMLQCVLPLMLAKLQVWVFPFVAIVISFVAMAMYFIGALGASYVIYLPEQIQELDVLDTYDIFLTTLHMDTDTRVALIILVCLMFFCSLCWTMGVLHSIYRCVLAHYFLHHFGALRKNKAVPLTAPLDLSHFPQDAHGVYGVLHSDGEETGTLCGTLGVLLRGVSLSVFNLGPHALCGATLLPRTLLNVFVGGAHSRLSVCCVPRVLCGLGAFVDRVNASCSTYGYMVLAQHHTTLAAASVHATDTISKTLVAPPALSADPATQLPPAPMGFPQPHAHVHNPLHYAPPQPPAAQHGQYGQLANPYTTYGSPTAPGQPQPAGHPSGYPVQQPYPGYPTPQAYSQTHVQYAPGVPSAAVGALYPMVSAALLQHECYDVYAVFPAVAAAMFLLATVGGQVLYEVEFAKEFTYDVYPSIYSEMAQHRLTVLLGLVVVPWVVVQFMWAVPVMAARTALWLKMTAARQLNAAHTVAGGDAHAQHIVASGNLEAAPGASQGANYTMPLYILPPFAQASVPMLTADLYAPVPLLDQGARGELMRGVADAVIAALFK